MAEVGWKQLLDGWPWYRGAGSYPVWPDSEFMPPVHVGRKPYGCWDPIPLDDADPWGWPITEYEEALTLRPGLESIAEQVMTKLRGLCQEGGDSGEIAEYKLRENPYWPRELAARAHTLEHERFVLLLPLALSLTEDDRAWVRWTLFGGSEQGPARAFWKSFYTAPGQEAPVEQALDFIRALLAGAYGEPAERLSDLRAAGFRVLDDQEPLPSWAVPYLWTEREPLRGVKYLLTFRPFAELPAAVRRRYLAGELHLLPFPGSLLFWGIADYHRLQRQLPFALQVPLLHFVERRQGLRGIRVPQAGWFTESGPAAPSGYHRGPLRETYQRTSRTARFHRDQDQLRAARHHRLVRVLFSTESHDIDLYHKPMARNVQLWDHDFTLLLDGPTAGSEEIQRAAARVVQGGMFGYRFQFPAHRLGRHEVYWQRPLVAYFEPRTRRPVVLPDALLGYLTAYPHDAPDLAQPIELWPRLSRREAHVLNVQLFQQRRETPRRRTLHNVHALLHANETSGRPLPRSFARQLLALRKDQSLEGWLRALPRHTRRPTEGRRLVEHLERCLECKEQSQPADTMPAALTLEYTANRAFEVELWNTIASLSAGDYLNKNNADCVLDAPTQARLIHHQRDLDPLGDYLLDYYSQLIAAHGFTSEILLGELPFQWQTQYAFPWMGGWLKNQTGEAHERNLVVVIPGRDRSQAVVLTDHYDTAYMSDRFEPDEGGTGARLAAPGADDNCAATATVMLGARVFMELSRQGRLGCDVWLVHLTGEEYPAEGQGACRLCQWLIEGTLKLRTRTGAWHDLSSVRVRGIYVMDMIAHNGNRQRDTFQISPGTGAESLQLAYQAHVANELWNAAAAQRNRTAARRRAGRGRRSRDGHTIPPLARFPHLHGEVRLPFDPRSTLYNTDGQAFSDRGIPVALLMENYDINRRGYHDSHDNLSQINLDYGAALAAIAIEATAQVACGPPSYAGW
jgi:hypothetical protein